MTYTWPPLAETLDDLKVAAGAPNAAAIERRVDAAASWVQAHRPDLFPAGAPAPTEAPSDDIGLGTVMLACRLVARTGSPLGVATFAEFGPSSILRLDPDIERLLGLGRNATPAIG
jgi:hypothetical protein